MGRKLLSTRDKDKETIVVLYELTENLDITYVTWYAHKDSPSDTFWGHYFNDIVDAVHGFDRR